MMSPIPFISTFNLKSTYICMFFITFTYYIACIIPGALTAEDVDSGVYTARQRVQTPADQSNPPSVTDLIDLVNSLRLEYKEKITERRPELEYYKKSIQGVVESQKPLVNVKGSPPTNVHLIKSGVLCKEWYLDTVALTMNGRRSQDEDAVLVVSTVGKRKHVRMQAVFDGHGGKDVSRLAATLAPSFFGRMRNFESDSFVEACLALDEGINVSKRSSKSGSTGIITMVQQPDPSKASFVLHAANVGDSRAFVIHRNGTFTPLSADHKPDSAEETKRIEAANGTVTKGAVSRVNGVLALSRAFGDFSLKRHRKILPSRQGVIAVPDIRSIPVHPGDILVIACDGVFEAPAMNWDFVANMVAAKIKENPDNLEEVAVQVLNSAYMLGSGDNISIVLTKILDSQQPFDATGVKYSHLGERSEMDIRKSSLSVHQSGATVNEHGTHVTLF